MKGLLTANVRNHARRYIATSLAVAISAAFIVVFLCIGNGLNHILTMNLNQQYRGVAVEAKLPEDTDPTYEEFQSLATKIHNIPGVRSVVIRGAAYLDLKHGGEIANAWVQPRRPAPFSTPSPSRGTLPSEPHDIVIDSGTASLLGADIGSTIEASGAAESNAQSVSLTVTGIIDVSTLDSSTGSSNPKTVMTQAGLDTIPGNYFSARSVLIAGKTDAPTVSEQNTLAETVSAALGNSAVVTTGHNSYENTLKQMNFGAASVVFLVFPLISVAVAFIVVTTTFQVIMAQRTRELALLRAVGATRKQVRSLVIYEALLVGAISSAVGVIVGALLGATLLTGFNILPLEEAFIVSLNPTQLIVTWLLGALITMFAGVRPALAMARLSPIAALSAGESDGGINQTSPLKAHKVSFTLSMLVLILSGLGMLGGIINLPGTSAGFLIAFLSGIVFMIASMMVSVVLLPYLTRLLGRGLRGVTGTLARENSVREPRRTAATGVAIAIGVALIVTMGVGAASVQKTFLTQVDSSRPFDFDVSSTNGSLTEADLDTLKGVEGTDGVIGIKGTPGLVTSAGDGNRALAQMNENATDNNPSDVMSIQGIPDLNAVAHSPIGPIPDDVVRVPQDNEFPEMVDVCALSPEDTQETGTSTRCVTLKTEPVPRSYGIASVSAATLEKIAPDAPLMRAAVKLADGKNARAVSSNLRKANPQFYVSGTAEEREMYISIINGMLIGAVVLLGVSVLIALVGVSNTLSLSVTERTRETGLLRALGMTKRSIRRMLSLEAILIALSGSAIGIVVGVILGAVGTYALPTEVDQVLIEVPWWLLLAVIALAIISALVASVIPARQAGRTSPIEALATE